MTAMTEPTGTDRWQEMLPFYVAGTLAEPDRGTGSPPELVPGLPGQT